MKPERKPMPECTPEAAGVPSSAIRTYLASLKDRRLALHSLLVVRRGKLIFEGYWKPMNADFRHRLYSCSKSFVACATGLLEEQGLLSLDDRAISFFPDKAPEHPHPWLEEMTIRDLLRMATCYEDGATYKPTDKDWESTFFTGAITHAPGMVYSYCTTATTMLCMIIRRVSGKEFTQVLRPVFDELGISEELYCIETPCGHEWGGSGVMATSREFAKFANLCMHYGEHEGCQLLPRRFMIEATSKQIDNSLYGSAPDSCAGYGYQFWCMRGGGFTFRGMGGQFALCLPSEDLLVVTTGYEELGLEARGEIFSAFWRDLVPALASSSLPENPEEQRLLAALGESLELVRPDGAESSPAAEAVSGKVYRMAENRMGMRWICFDFGAEQGVMRYENATGVHELPFGLGRHVACQFPETHYNGPRIGVPWGRGLDCQVSAAWMMENELMIFCHVIDVHLAQLRIAAAFTGDRITLHIQKHAEFFLEEYEGFATGEAQ